MGADRTVRVGASANDGSDKGARREDRAGKASPDIEKEYWDTKECAVYLGYSEKTIRKYIESGILPGGKVGGRYRIPKKEAKEAIRQIWLEL